MEEVRRLLAEGAATPSVSVAAATALLGAGGALPDGVPDEVRKKAEADVRECRAMEASLSGAQRDLAAEQKACAAARPGHTDRPPTVASPGA